MRVRRVACEQVDLADVLARRDRADLQMRPVGALVANIESTAAEWYPKMKPGAVKAVIAVTDDDAVAPVKGMPTPLAVAEAEAARFHEMLIENFPGFKGRYAFHAITGIAGQVCANIARVGPKLRWPCGG